MVLAVDWEKDSSISRASLSELLTHILNTQEEDYRSIAIALQEDVGQTVAGLALHLRAAGNTCTDSQCTRSIKEALTLARDVMQNLDQLTRGLYPPALHNQGLCPALEVYAKDFAKLTSIPVELDLEVLDSPPPITIRQALFRITQEALANVSRHACANFVRVTLRRVGTQLFMMIEDDGVGYSAEMNKCWGLLRMKHRAESLGGTCWFQSELGNGTRVKVMIPMQNEGA
jgi:signal transduction histidine kinase